MNERIDEIAFQAGCIRYSYNNTKHPDLSGFIVNQETLDNFAELIITACIKVGCNAMYNDNSKVQTFPTKQIKEYFGIYNE